MSETDFEDIPALISDDTDVFSPPQIFSIDLNDAYRLSSWPGAGCSSPSVNTVIPISRLTPDEISLFNNVINSPNYAVHVFIDDIMIISG